MRKLKILVTGAGAPGIQGTIYSLRNNYDKRKVKIIGTDINSDVVGKYLCDQFYLIPKALDTENYLYVLLGICINEKVNIVIPQNTAELNTLASNKDKFLEVGTSIIVSNENSINIANNKFNLMTICHENNIPVGKFYLVNKFNNLIQYSKELGWPEKKVVVKPPISNGLRGVRIIDEKINLKRMFYEEKPTSLFIKMEDLEKILGATFPELIVTEYLKGIEYTVDVLKTNKNIIIIPRKRDLIRYGITFSGTTEFNKSIISYSKLISEIINLEYCFGFQFKLDEAGIPKILESNPRVQGTMVLSTLAGANIIYTAIKYILGEDIPSLHIKWNTKLLRYWGGISIYNGQKMVQL